MYRFISPLIMLALVVWLFPDVASAQTAPGGLVSCNGWECGACDVIKMVNKLIIWLFGIIFLLFAGLMAIAGFGLVTSGGNQSALEAAKSKFTNAIIGIIIMMAAWLIVDTIMKGLLKNEDGSIDGWGPWSEIECKSYVQPGQWTGDPEAPVPPGGSPVTPLPGPAPTACSGASCAPLGIPCKAGVGCSISPDLVDNFQAFHAAAGVDGARVTEGMPPTRVHKSACHQQGTCIDYGKSGGMTPAEVVKVIDAAKANGLRPVYEVKTQAEKDAIVAGGASANDVKVLGDWISAPHFSIYGK